MKHANDGDEFGRQMIAMLQDPPESITVDNIVSFAEVHETHVEWCVILARLLHQYSQGKQLVSATTTTAETTLTVPAEKFCIRLKTVEDGSTQHFARDTK